MFPDFCEQPEDKITGRSILFKTVNDLAGGYHPNLKKLMGPASRTNYVYLLGQQDGLYHILHVLSPQGALCDLDTGTLPALTVAKDANGHPGRPVSAWGHDYPPATVALQSLSGPWADAWLCEMIDDKPLPWSALADKEGSPVCTWFGVNYGLVSIRDKTQRIHVLGQWRRKAERPSTMCDIGTLDMRIGFNQTQIGSDGAGMISEQGKYHTYQYGNKLIMLAQPQPDIIAQQAAEHQFGQRKLPAQEIHSVQCTAALFNYEQPHPTWEIFVDDRKVEALPATAKYGQVITIHDGVSYLAIRPLPTDDLGRDSEIRLEAGQPQTEAYHEDANIQPSLLINAYLYQKDTAMSVRRCRNSKRPTPDLCSKWATWPSTAASRNSRRMPAPPRCGRARRSSLPERQGYAGRDVGRLHRERNRPVCLHAGEDALAGYAALADGQTQTGEERRNR